MAFRAQRERVRRVVEDAGRWLSERRAASIPIDLAVRFYERDRDSFGSVLGSAIAFRLFLLMVPMIFLILGLVVLVVGLSGLTVDAKGPTGLSGELAKELAKNISRHSATAWLLGAGGLLATFLAGRALTKVLAAVSARAWVLDPRDSKVPLHVDALATALFGGVVVVSWILHRLENIGSIAVTASSLVGVTAAYAVIWFALTIKLPRTTSDPGALLPGAAFFGLVMAGLQAFSRMQLPSRLRESSEVLGDLGLTVLALGWLFIVGRVMTASLVLNAVIFEETGSVSALLFRLPVLRLIPERYPSVGRYFDLGHHGHHRPDSRGASTP